jgi:hypothetical protein
MLEETARITKYFPEAITRVNNYKEFLHAMPKVFLLLMRPLQLRSAKNLLSNIKILSRKMVLTLIMFNYKFFCGKEAFLDGIDPYL